MRSWPKTMIYSGREGTVIVLTKGYISTANYEQYGMNNWQDTGAPYLNARNGQRLGRGRRRRLRRRQAAPPLDVGAGGAAAARPAGHGLGLAAAARQRRQAAAHRRVQHRVGQVRGHVEVAGRRTAPAGASAAAAADRLQRLLQRPRHLHKKNWRVRNFAEFGEDDTIFSRFL